MVVTQLWFQHWGGEVEDPELQATLSYLVSKASAGDAASTLKVLHSVPSAPSVK